MPVFVFILGSTFHSDLCPLVHAGMKTVISELSPSSHALVASICKKIVGRLTSAISKVRVAEAVFCLKKKKKKSQKL